MKTSFNLIISPTKLSTTAIVLFKILTAVIILLSIAGCSDFFSVRDAEEPFGGNTISNAKTPKEVIELFEKALKDNKSSLYMSLLSDSLQTGRAFHFSSEAADVSASSFSFWDRTDEQQFIKPLLSNSTITGEITVNPYDEPQLDTIQIKFNYNLLLNKSIKIKGLSSFILIKTNSIWYIVKWHDYHLPLNDEVSFSKLKLSPVTTCQ